MNIDFDFEQKFIKKSRESEGFPLFISLLILVFPSDPKKKTAGSNENLEFHAVLTETSNAMEARLISIKKNNSKKPFFLDMIKIVIICVFSLVFLVSNYVLDQRSINDLANIYNHIHYLHYRPVCVRFKLLSLMNQIYERNDCDCAALQTEYQGKIENNEKTIFQTELPWVKLKNYYRNFTQINYHDLCVGVFEAQNEFKQIIGIFGVSKFLFLHFCFRLPRNPGRVARPRPEGSHAVFLQLLCVERKQSKFDIRPSLAK